MLLILLVIHSLFKVLCFALGIKAFIEALPIFYREATAESLTLILFWLGERHNFKTTPIYIGIYIISIYFSVSPWISLKIDTCRQFRRNVFGFRLKLFVICECLCLPFYSVAGFLV